MTTLSQMMNVITVEEKKKLIEYVGELNKDACIEIFKIVQNYTNKYTKNNNGIFINLNNLDNNCLCEIKKFVDFCRDNEKKLKEKEALVETEKTKIINPDTLSESDSKSNDDNNKTVIQDNNENDQNDNNEDDDNDNNNENDNNEDNNNIDDTVDNEINNNNDDINDNNENENENENEENNKKKKDDISGTKINLKRSKAKYTGVKDKLLKNYKKTTSQAQKKKLRARKAVKKSIQKVNDVVIDEELEDAIENEIDSENMEDLLE